MSLHEAIEKYLSLYNSGTLDERIFFNVLKDYNAFEQLPAAQNVVRAFIGKGFLEDIWKGKSGWQMSATQQLSNFMGFQDDLVNDVIQEVSIGFKKYCAPNVSPDIVRNIQGNIVASEIPFRKYDIESTKASPSVSTKPDNFKMHVGDIIMVKNGVARITAINDNDIRVVYPKRGGDGVERSILYDEKMEYIISPEKCIFLKSMSGRYFYVSDYNIDNENIKFIGTYADRINKVTLIPYNLLHNGFKVCNEEEFLSQCIDIEKFNKFRTNK